MSWKLVTTSNFERETKRLKKTVYYDKFLKVLDELKESEDPRKLGEAKTGQLAGYFGYPLGYNVRILYKVDFEAKTIVFYSVGPHDTVYRKRRP